MRRPVFAVALLFLGLVGGAAAQEPYPTRPVTIIVPYPPGGVADLTARPFAPALERALKQPVIIANKPGAAGAVGMQSVAVAKPDGYTLMITVLTISTIPEVDTLFGRPPAFKRDDFAPLARLVADPPLYLVGAATPWKSVKELVEDAKRRPGEIIFSSAGLYTPSHLATEILAHAAGIRLRHVPHTGGGPAMNALLGGHAGLSALSTAAATPQIKGGKLRALSHSGAQRLAAFPDVPTLKELGYDGELYLWAGLFAPRNLPAHVQKILRDATRQAVQDPEFKGGMEKMQAPVAYQDAEEFRAWWDRDTQMLAETIKRIGKVEAK